MTEETSDIRGSTLTSLSLGPGNAPRKSTFGRMPLGLELMATLAFLAFYPLAYFGLMDGTVEMHFGSKHLLLTNSFALNLEMIALVGALVSGGFIAWTLQNMSNYNFRAPLRMAISLYAMSLIIMAVAAMFYMVFVVLFVGFGGFEAIAMIWKGLLFFGFIWWSLKTASS